MIAEVERFYGVSPEAEATLQIARPMPSPDECPPENQSSSPGFGPLKSHEVARTIAAPNVGEGQGSDNLDGTETAMYELTDQFWRLTQTTLYELQWSASCTCSICRKWAVCIDSSHCWNRD
jgi:hypothetical protein